VKHRYVLTLARKAVASHGMRQWPQRRMDIPANREDPGCIGCRSCGVSVKKARGTSRPRFLGAWLFSPDLRHFRWIMTAVKFESFEMSEARAGKP
jgi:hypothetical protein